MMEFDGNAGDPAGRVTIQMPKAIARKIRWSAYGTITDASPSVRACSTRGITPALITQQAKTRAI